MPLYQIAEKQFWHARLAERRDARVRGPKFEVFWALNPDLRTSDRDLSAGKSAAPQLTLVSRFLFSILLHTRLPIPQRQVKLHQSIGSHPVLA
jgi:hypothetical protein